MFFAKGQHGESSADVTGAQFEPMMEQLEGRVLMSAVSKLRIQDANAIEGSATSPGRIVFTVVRTGSVGQAVQSKFRTIGLPGSPNAATLGTDLTPTVGKVKFEAGQRTKFVVVNLVGNSNAQNDRVFGVQLFKPKAAKLADAVGVGTILDDDGPGKLAISDASTIEGDNGTKPMTFTVTLSRASNSTVTVKYKTTEIGGKKNAQAGEDYIGTSGTLTFAPGETKKTITVQIVGDTSPAQSLVERFYVDLSNAKNAVITDSRGEGLITDNDTA